MISDKIIKEVGEGKEASFNKVFYEYGTKLVMYVDGIVEDKYAAEDIVMEMMEKLPIMIKEKYYEIGNFKSWLYKIARNRSITYIREVKRKKEVSLESYEYDKKESFRIEELKEILGKDEYKVIVYKYKLKLTVREISKITDNSKDKINRMLKKAYPIIEKYYIDNYLK